VSAHPSTPIVPLRRRTAAAVQDATLRASLAGATASLTARKAAGYAELADVEELRAAARATRSAIIRRLPEILDRLTTNVAARGGQICWASTPGEATAYIADVARRTNARRIVKSKSMVSEEISLNHVLERMGCEVTETDLGEWIIQLAGETPSHILAPAIHKNRQQVAKLFQETHGVVVSDEPEALTAFARERLRERFLAADIGISGANFGVAETGTIVLVTNEGNGRLVTSLPRVHIAVMGLERVVETWDQLDVLMALLPRAATGQPISCYLSMISGPRQPLPNGSTPEFHLVILDNGRSDLLGTEFTEMLACIRCGACLNACPVYRQVGGHAYGPVYTGPMGAVLSPLLATTRRDYGDLPQASSLCGACWQACPVGIPLQDMLLAHRRRAARDMGFVERTMWKSWAGAWSKPASYRASLAALRSAIGVGRLTGSAPRWLPFLDRWTTSRELPKPPRTSFRDLWKAGIT
jgi:L-lactate dehydrogenase complex protein LldF